MIVNEVGVREWVQFETCQQQVGVLPKYCNQCKSKLNKVFMPVTRREKGYTRFVGKYVTGRRKRERVY